MADRLLIFFEENLKSTTVTKDLICYKGGTKTVAISLVSSKTKEKYIVMQEDNGKMEQKEYDSIEDALISIDKGLFLYGQEVYLDEQYKNFKDYL